MFKYIKLFSLLVLFASCKKDFLDTMPTASVDDASIFTTTTNARNVINGVYRYMYSTYSTQNQPGHGGMMLQLDFMGEDINQAAATWYTNTANGAANWIEHRNESDIWVEFPFRLYYRVIGNCNALIDNIANAAGPDTAKNMLRAEALALRAWSYHNLVRIFAKRYDKASKPNNQLGVSLPLSAKDVKFPRSTVEEVYTRINLDLDEAIILFATAASPVAGVSQKSHITMDAAKAIKASVALTMQEYELAASLAKQVIDGNKSSLMSVAQYQGGFNDISNPEWIWGVFMQSDQGSTFGSFAAQISWNANTTYVRSRPKRVNSALYNLFPATDVRKKMWEPTPNATNFPLPLSTYIREPYMSRKFKTKTDNTSLADVPYLRLAEVYLIMAEAYANIAGKEADAKKALFDLVVKRDPSYVLSTNTGAALLEEILNNRRIELWGEGFRFYDLKRLNRPLDRDAVPNYNSISVGGTMKIPAGDPRWQFAIPIDEIRANPNTKRNE